MRHLVYDTGSVLKWRHGHGIVDHNFEDITKCSSFLINLHYSTLGPNKIQALHRKSFFFFR